MGSLGSPSVRLVFRWWNLLTCLPPAPPPHPNLNLHVAKTTLNMGTFNKRAVYIWHCRRSISNLLWSTIFILSHPPRQTRPRQTTPRASRGNILRIYRCFTCPITYLCPLLKHSSVSYHLNIAYVFTSLSIVKHYSVKKYWIQSPDSNCQQVWNSSPLVGWSLWNLTCPKQIVNPDQLTNSDI